VIESSHNSAARIQAWARCAALAVALGAAALASAQGAGPSFAVKARLLYTGAARSEPIENGVLIVRDGKVAEVGANLEIPPDLPVHDLRDRVLCPGFVLAASAIVPPHGGEASVSGAFRAADAFDPYADYTPYLARGITTAHLDPGGHRLVSGRGAVVKLAGPPDARVLSPSADLTINLGVFDAPPVVERPFYASSDVPIEPARFQRPASRVGQLLELRERLELIAAGKPYTGLFERHGAAFAQAWTDNLPLRVQARRAADISAAVRFLKESKRRGYLVGLSEAEGPLNELAKSGLPLVIRVETWYRGPDYDTGGDPDALLGSLEIAASLRDAFTGMGGRGGAQLALAGREGDAGADPQLIASLAMVGGLSREDALCAVTGMPAEILGLGGRVGVLEKGADADFLVLNDLPLNAASRVVQTYVNGALAYEAPESDALVVRAGRVWTGDGPVIHDGSVLVEDGRIVAVGHRVAIPAGARVIDAGPDGFVTPGFIDAHGHLGLEGDRTEIGSEVPLHQVVGGVTREFLNVARAGVTSVILSAYRTNALGARVTATKTYGEGRDELLTEEICAVQFVLRDADPLLGDEAVRKRLDEAKKYDEKWKKYYEELAKWREQKAAGVKVEAKAVETTQVTEKGPDPITGTWSYTLSGGPIPEPVSGELRLKLTGTRIEGRMQTPGSDDAAEVLGELDGKRVTLRIQEETPFGEPTIEGELDAEDHVTGTVKLGEMFTLDFEATRTDKSDVQFSVTRSKRASKDGRPIAPDVDERLEPYRKLLTGERPALVHVRTVTDIELTLKLFVDDHKIPVILLDAEEAEEAAAAIEKRAGMVSVIATNPILWRRERLIYNQPASLAARGVPVALQSSAEDGARTLPLMARYAVHNGLGADAALRALTVDAAKMFKLDDRIGMLAPQRAGDLLIFSGHPFDAGARLLRVVVGGREVPHDRYE